MTSDVLRTMGRVATTWALVYGPVLLALGALAWATGGASSVKAPAVAVARGCEDDACDCVAFRGR